MYLSIIIPALNESDNIVRTIQSVKACFTGKVEFEVIVSDNGSDDNTVELACNHGATTTIHPDVNIGELRNLGAKLAKGDIFLFLDADTTLSNDWYEEFINNSNSILNNRYITGSRCLSPNPQNPFSKFWFNLLFNKASQQYIGSAHLVLSRSLFYEIDGFNPLLKTGEDHDLCQRATEIGAKIYPNSKLIAYHHGYPQTIKAFFNRELWHGQGDIQKSFIPKDPIYVVSGLVFISTVIILMCFIAGSIFQSTVIAIGVILLLTAISFYKFPKLSLTLRLGNIQIIYIYCIARALSVVFRGQRIR